MSKQDRPLSHWMAVARMGFERDFHRIFTSLGISRSELATEIGVSPAYISKVLNGRAGNFTLATMAKWARAIGAIVQIRLVKEGEEVVRVLDYETASSLDDAKAHASVSTSPTSGRLLSFSLRTDESVTPASGEMHARETSTDTVYSVTTEA